MTQRDAEIDALVSSLRDHGWHTAASALLQYAERERKYERDMDKALEERDCAEDALLAASQALGGPEWCAKLPPEPPPNSGDLARDVPLLCVAAAEREQRLRDALLKTVDGLRDAITWVDDSSDPDGEDAARGLRFIEKRARAALAEGGV